LLIAFVIVITSSSFTLGFFVGKTVDGNKRISPLQKEQKPPLTPEEKTLIDLRLARKEEGREKGSAKREETETNHLLPPVSLPKTVTEAKQTPPIEIPEEKGVKPYYIQVAALRNSSDAKKVQEGLEKKGVKSIVVKHIIEGKGTFYKVRLDGFATKEEAAKVLETLKKKGIKGFIGKSATERQSGRAIER